jgi:hypothetical protein
MSSAAADFDAAMAALNSLHVSTTAPRETYFLDTETPSSLIDSHRYPKCHDTATFITPGHVAVRSNVFSVSWLVVLFKILDQLSLLPSDTVVELDCGDGRWLIEVAKRHRCACVGYGTDSDHEYVCDKMSYEQEIVDLVDYRVVDNIISDSDLADASAVIVHLTQENMSALRDKLEEELDPYAPVVVVGGEIIGWIHQWSTKHRGVPVYLYSRRTHGLLGDDDMHSKYRSKGAYRNPNDRMVPIVDNPVDKKHFHLEDLGSLDRADGTLPGTQIERKQYGSHYKPFVHTPHVITKK